MTKKQKRPIGCIYPDCLNCPLSDCEYNELESEDYAESRERDLEAMFFKNPNYKKRKESQRKYIKSDKGKAAQKRYSQSDKGKQAQARYAKTDKFKEAQKRYLQSDKGKEKAKRHTQKQIESGKNAEYCKRYYENHKEELKQKARERYRTRTEVGNE